MFIPGNDSAEETYSTALAQECALSGVTAGCGTVYSAVRCTCARCTRVYTGCVHCVYRGNNGFTPFLHRFYTVLHCFTLFCTVSTLFCTVSTVLLFFYAVPTVSAPLPRFNYSQFYKSFMLLCFYAQLHCLHRLHRFYLFYRPKRPEQTITRYRKPLWQRLRRYAPFASFVETVRNV